MKRLVLISGMLATILLFTCTMAQQVSTSLDPPGVTVVEKKWYRNLPPSGRNTNPFTLHEDYERRVNAEKASINRNDLPPPGPTAQDKTPIPALKPKIIGPSRYTNYVYQIKVQNNGAKRIKLVDWEYQFLDTKTGELMGSRRIPSKTRISPGQTQVLKVRQLQQPTAVVNADQLDKEYRDQFTERVIIHRIEYSDGTTWERPSR